MVECAYDSMGRRAYKKVTVDGSVTLHQRYIYLGYLQIACIDLTRSHHPVMWLLTWDPTQPVATRPLAIRINGTWYTYGWDLTKNICELYSTEGRISTSYTYSPFGKVTATGSVTQPIQWSSEMWDSELGLMYYNWRYYNAAVGRWIQKDFITSKRAYTLINNSTVLLSDYLGLFCGQNQTDNIILTNKRYYIYSLSTIPVAIKLYILTHSRMLNATFLLFSICLVGHSLNLYHYITKKP